MSVAELTQKYLALRRRKDQLIEIHKEALHPFNDMLATLANLILAELNSAGVTSMSSPDGTVYKSTETSVTVKDWPATLSYILAQQAWDLLEARVSKTAVLTVMNETDEPIPGVNVTQESVLRVRRS
jgi:hypothetical protein